MSSESTACNGYYPDNGNTIIGNYFSQLSSSSSCGSSNSNTSSGTSSTNQSSENQWSTNMPTSQQQHTTSQHHHAQQHHQQQQQQRQQPQQQSVPPMPNNRNHHLFNNTAYNQRTNPWNIPNMSCYQRIYGDNHYQGFHVPNSIQSSSNSDSSVLSQQHINSSNKRYGGQSGKSGNSKDICGDDKFKEDGDPWNVEAQAAFLGPNLWDKTLPYDADLKVTQYADLDEFLSENNIPDGLPGTHLGHSTGLGHRSDSLGHSAGLSLGLGHVTTKRERSPSPSDCVSPDTISPPSPAESTFSFASSGRDFDPRTRAFSDEELKPQPMIKKSRKQFVPDELKDDKYWARRRKNNIAAKRSRDARRQKENQIAMRARYLEKENSTLHQEVEQLKQENMELRARLSKYQEV